MRRAPALNTPLSPAVQEAVRVPVSTRATPTEFGQPRHGSGRAGLPAENEPPKKRRCSASWARLISKIFHADPLTCRKCGKLKVVAYLHDTVAIRQILDYLGLSPPEEPKPPPAVQEVVRAPVDEEGREIEAL